MTDTTKTPSNGPATSKDISYLLRDIDELKRDKADKDYVAATDRSLEELICAKLGDVEAMKKFIVTALIVLAGFMLGGGGVAVWRAACISKDVTQTTNDVSALSKDFKAHVTAQQVERIEDIVTLNSKLSFMEQRLMNAIARMTQGKSLAPPSNDEYVQLRRMQVMKDIERLEISSGIRLSPAAKATITDSVKDDVALLPKATLKSEVEP